MKEQQTVAAYESPKVEVTEVKVEQGFAISVDVHVNEWENGASIGAYDV